MNEREARCPSCGAGVNFRPGTQVSVCNFCSSIIARTDRDPELLGKASALVDTNSPLEVGAEGSYKGSRFALVGRTQLAHPAGGIWDEWYLAFEDGRWGWLAEAQGRFFLTFKLEDPDVSPTLYDCEPGAPLDLGRGGQWVVHEVGTARVLSAEGELPYAYDPDATYDYADLSGTKGRFGTIDFSEDPPIQYIGREVSLQDLGVQPRGGFSSRPEIASAALSCPNCGGTLELRLPDQSQRVTCPSCDGLLETSAGTLRHLSTLPHIDDPMLIPLGAEGTLGGVPYTCVGFMRRSCTIEGETYFWDEYLLYCPEEGFRFLTVSDGHWNFVDPLNAADVVVAGSNVVYEDQTYKLFQDTWADVEYVRGEFYWRVEVGERVDSADFINPPFVISREISEAGGSGDGGAREVNWSLGTYINGAEIWEAFGLEGCPPPATGVGANQPSPYKRISSQVVNIMLIALAVLGVMFLGSIVTTTKDVVFQNDYTLPFEADDKGQQVMFSEPFEIKDSHRSVKVHMKSTVSNSWLVVDGALVSEETGAVSMFYIETSYYFGPGWSEGKPEQTISLSALPPGQYVLRVAPEWEKNNSTPSFSIDISTGQIREIYPALTLILILCGPLAVWLLSSAYENRRWEESAFSRSD